VFRLIDEHVSISMVEITMPGEHILA